MVDRERPETAARWLALIGKAKAALPCRAADSRHIWERFREFNRRRGRKAVPAGYLLGFMRKWRDKRLLPQMTAEAGKPAALSEEERALQRLISLAPVSNRHFHEVDLKQTIGLVQYERRLADIQEKFGCSSFQGKLALHGAAVKAREIAA